ncbi:MAG: hypothetical protein KAX56_15730 [Phenylobacterium sp.]|nr:hypothetical protein [Phenylobacterium sp.]
MLSEARQDFLIELRGVQGGLGVMLCPPSVPRAHRFQGGLIYSRMIEIEGRVLAPEGFGDRRIRIWLDQLESWHFSRSEPPQIGDIYDRAGELPGAGLETTLYIPEDAWLTATICLNTVWRRLRLTGVDGDGRSMRLVDASFSSGDPTRP